MKKILIIIQREFLKRVQKKSFILLTIATPFLMAALICIPLWLSSVENDKQQHVAVIDPSGVYVKALQGSRAFEFTARPALTKAMQSDDSPYDAVVTVSGDLVKNQGAVKVYSRKEVPANLLDYIHSRFEETVQKQKLASAGIPGLDKIIVDVQQSVPVETVKWNDEGEQQASNTDVAIAVGFIFTFLIYMFVVSYGAMVMQSVIEEKTNRIVELLVSSVKPFQLMMGKVIGVMLVGLSQLALWAVMLAVILGIASAGFGVTVMSPEVKTVLTALTNLPYIEISVMFLLMFIGGYLLYASFFAATGASINEQEDAHQFIVPVTLITLFGLYAAMYSVENTDGPLAFWTSLFPLTSPIVMMVRIPFGVPLWQEVLSVVLLYATAFLMIWLGGRIYRVGILMYGKKPTIKEIMRWLKY